MCWQSYGRRWERQPERAFQPANTEDLRISDSDRERAVAQLSKHAGEGRLTLEEFEARAADVYAAKTNADLRPAFRGLPWYDDTSARHRRSQTRRHMDLENVLRPLVMLGMFVLLVGAALAWGVWVLFVGLWFGMHRFGWSRARRHRAQRLDYDHRVDRAPDEELTTV
jgi:hypothetical protein